MRIVTPDVQLPVALLTPTSKPATGLAKVATHVRHIGPYLGPCQFPDVIKLPNGTTVTKPPGW